MGQFHVDFSMEGAKSEIYGVKNVFLSKTYIDILEQTGKYDNIINEEHIRMRGTPTACIKYYAQQNDMTVGDTYKKLNEGEAVEFDLTNEGNKSVCKNNRDHAVPNVNVYKNRRLH